MALNGNSFAAKLHELEDEYRLLRLRIQQGQRLDSAQLRQALTSVLADCRKTSQSLARSCLLFTSAPIGPGPAFLCAKN